MRCATIVFAAFFCWATADASAQSRLDGTSFLASTYNLPDSVGVVRLVDTGDSNCRSELGTPVGNDAPTDACLVTDAGTPPVAMNFNAGPQTIGGLTVIPTAAPFAGVDPNNPIEAFNLATEQSFELATWSTSGDLIEFTLRTTDDSYPANNEDDFFGFAATGIQYPNADPAAEVGFFRDDVLDTHNNFYIWFENADGPIATGYDIFLPVGLGVGRHPTDESREVVYIFYSDGEVDENTDTLAGGSLDFYSHGSDLDADPAIGNLLFLADNVGLFGLGITGFGVGMLVEPPESAALVGDCNGDGAVNAADLACVTTIADRDVVLAAIPTLAGDLDGNGEVAFPDFLTLSNNFGRSDDVNYTQGDVDLSGSVAFPDFLTLSDNFGKTPAVAAAVPEPAGGVLALLGLGLALLGRRRAR